jgi:signal transduction histidine kinase/ActR/RegA family two-component response regulator
MNGSGLNSRIYSRKKLLAPLCLGFAIITGLALWTVHHFYSSEIDRRIASHRESVTRHFNLELKEQTDLMTDLGRLLMSDTAIMSAFNHRDRARIHPLIQRYIGRFYDRYGVNQIALIDPDSTKFFTGFASDQHGEHSTVDGEVATLIVDNLLTGIKQNPDGCLVYRTVVPINKQDSSGFVLLESEVSDIMERITNVEEIGLIMTIDKRYLDRALWEEAISKSGFAWHWESLPHCVAVGQTINMVPMELGEYTHPINSGLHDDQFSLNHGEKNYACTSLPVKDASQRAVGRLYILQDITSLRHSYHLWFGAILMISLIVCGLTAVFLDNHLGRGQQELLRAESFFSSNLTLQERLKAVEGVNKKLARVQRLAKIGYWNLNFKNNQISTTDEAREICGLKTAHHSFSIFQLLRLIHPEDRSSVIQGIKLIVAGGNEQGFDFRLKARDNHPERILYAEAILIRSAQGKPIKLEGFVQDITDNVKAEAQKRQLEEKLKRADRMNSLGLMASGVAHDLNNMLGPLVGYPELLLRKLPEESPLRKQIKKIGVAAREAAEVVQDLLTLARRDRYEMEPLNLNQAVLDYLDSANFDRLKEEKPEVALALELSERPIMMKGSATHIHQIIMNLVVNAFDAMPTGGKLTISTELRQLYKLISGYAAIPRGEYLLLRVADTGMGIPEEALDRIFEPYFSKKKMGRSGSGLGLAVVYSIVKDHGGYYDVFSKEGKFTEFVLYFPALNEPAELPHEVSGLSGGSESLLVVDDSASQLELAYSLLTSLGYTVYTAMNSTEALDLYKKHRFDVVLLDMVMETGLDGLDIYRELLKINPNQRVVIASGASANERFQIAEALGAGPVLRKPFTLSAINLAVRRAIDSRQAELTA